MISRRHLLAGALAVGSGALPLDARATGGLDPQPVAPDAGPQPASGLNPPVRVLVASSVDPRAFSRTGDALFSYAGKTYRGGAAIVDSPDRRSALIATLPIDSYLYGVVPLEIGARWPEGALQAQAIVARTYALAHRILGRSYDLVAGEADQVWGGVKAEAPQTNAAIDATLGELVTYGGGLASVFYSSACGGHTTDATHLWGSAGLPYLRGVADPYCTTSPDAQWTVTLSVGAFLGPLAARIAPAGRVRQLVLRDPPADLRRPLAVIGERGTVELGSSEVRNLVGPRVLRSSLWRSLTVQGDPAQAATSIVLEGSGRGHGVGLCQWGAWGMAQQGRSAQEILAFYFPGTQIANA